MTSSKNNSNSENVVSNKNTQPPQQLSNEAERIHSIIVGENQRLESIISSENQRLAEYIGEVYNALKNQLSFTQDTLQREQNEIMQMQAFATPTNDTAQSDRIDGFHNELRDLYREFKSFAKINSEMGKELEQYKQNQLENLYLLPVLRFAAKLYADYFGFITKISDDTTKANFTTMFDEIEEFLSANGVEKIQSIENEDTPKIGYYDRLRSEPEQLTADETLNGKAAQSHKPGFAKGNKVIVRELVTTYRYLPIASYAEDSIEKMQNDITQLSGTKDDISVITDETDEIKSSIQKIEEASSHE